MLRNIGAVIAGYVIMFVVLFVTFTGAYLAMGADRAFKPGTYEASTAWIAVMILFGLVAAVAGGFACAAIARHSKAVLGLAGLVVVIGLLSAIPVLRPPANDPRPTVRDGSVGNMQAMMNARQTPWVALLNPFLGAVGAIVGGRLKKPAA